MGLEVRTKEKKAQFIVLPNWNPCAMYPYEDHNSKWQAEWSCGKHDVTVPIATGYRENKSCHGDKKEAWQKSLAASHPWNEYRKIFHTALDRD